LTESQNHLLKMSTSAARLTQILPLFLLTFIPDGQTKKAKPPSIGTPEASLAFEVATIKPVDPNVPGLQGPMVYPNGRVIIRRASLKDLITMAFDVGAWQVSGGTGWMNEDRFNIEAIPPENFAASKLDLRYTNWGIEDGHLRTMLQELIVERFRLKYHRRATIGRVYLLERSSKPFRLQPTKFSSDPESTPRPTEFSGDIGFAAGRWVLSNTSLPQLARFACEHILRAPVLDRTNIIGSFDYTQPTTLSDAEADYTDPSNSFLRLIKEIGLTLKPSRGPIDNFIIDQADRPTSN
jgi:uncharacterized protein (TIGR03435 family)